MKFLYLRKSFLSIFAIFIFAFNELINPASAAIQKHETWAELENRGVAALDRNEYWIAEPLLKQAMAQANSLNLKIYV